MNSKNVGYMNWKSGGDGNMGMGSSEIEPVGSRKKPDL